MKLNLFKRKEAIDNESVDKLRVIVDASRLSAANVEDLKQLYMSRFQGQSRMVLVFSRLTFVDSSGLGFLVALRNSMQAPKLLVLEGITDKTLIDLFALTRMDQIFILSSSFEKTQELLSQHA